MKLEGIDCETRVTIIDDDEPGILGFEARTIKAKATDKIVHVKIVR